MMKRLTLAIASILAAGGAFAAESFTENARVLSVTPINERIPVSREECWNENQRVYEDRTVTRSDTGAAIGPEVKEVERVPVDRTVQRCRTVQEVRDARVGYDVRYRYGGREFLTRLDRDPGPSLRVAVNVAPVEGREMGSPHRHRPRPGEPAYR
jgi:uncharacterized protein YcfJ